MGLLDWLVGSWYWFALAYALAFAVVVGLTVFTELRANGYRIGLRRASADGDSDADCRANLDLDRSSSPVTRIGEAGRRSILRADSRPGVGRHDADRNPVCTDEASVA